MSVITVLRAYHISEVQKQGEKIIPEAYSSETSLHTTCKI